ncbi:CynX/NimT family MFS transporter [Furfurilactobacillus sp. WILCCON 0119]|uniref:CynX/NimT family MFS transporter n=1 Tax=Furfurilactobacillus entadae TaxID=2922307 RepID=UPI0035EAF8B0
MSDNVKQAVKHSSWLLLGVILLGSSLRMVITVIPPILAPIQHTLHLSSSLAGSLTTIPLLCFAALSPIAPRISAKVGTEVALLIALIILVLGNWLRVYSALAMIIGTLLVGVGVAFLNVLLPALVAENYPTKIGEMTSLYSFSMTFFSAISAGVSAPLAGKIGWQFTVQIFSLVALVNVITWLPNLRYNHKAQPVAETSAATPHQSVWKQPTAWMMTLFMGLQSLVFYTLITWLPTLMVDRGVSANTASLLLGLYQIASLPAAYAVPIISARSKNQSALLLTIGGFFIVGIGGLLLPFHMVWYFAILCVILGTATTSLFALAMTLLNLKARTPQETADLSGMAQSLGYLIAAVGPIAYGTLHVMLHGWNILMAILLVLALLTVATAMYVNNREDVFH